MASPPIVCRLCITKSNDDFKSLYDEYGQANGLYEMTYDYFHPKIVDLDKAKHLTAVCLECFRHIHEFHSFQTSVTIAQLKLTEKDKTIYTITEDIETPRRESLTQIMAIKVEEEEEFIGLTPEYDVKKECPQIMNEEFITCSDIQLEDSSPSTSKKNYQIIESLSIGGSSASEEEDIKDNISLPTLEIMDIDTSSTYYTDDVISSGQLAARNPSLSENRSSDVIDTQMTDEQNLSYYQPKTKFDTLDYLLDKWIPNIKCLKCSKSFPKWPLLTIHFKLKHPNDRFYYKCCSRKFNRIQIKDHLRLHDNPDAFKCSICCKRYINSTNLASHYAESHPDSLKFPCDKCNKRCITKNGLANHRAKMHSSSQSDIPDSQVRHFKCSICDKSYARLTNLASHCAEMHPESGKFLCNKCGKCCVSKQGLANHYRRVHSSVLQECPVLQMHHTTPPTTNTDNTETKVRLSEEDTTLGPTNYEEDNQYNISLSEVPLLAQIDASSPSVSSSDTIDNQKSQKKYETLENLLAKWIPNIKCFKCKKSFPSWSFLRCHFKFQHPNEEFHYICCSRKFNRSQIKDHLCLHSDYDAFKCSICEIRYRTLNGLALHNTVKHSETLKFPCDKCTKRYTSNNALEAHQRMAHKSDRQYIPPDLQKAHSPQPDSKNTFFLTIQDSVFHAEDGKDNMNDSKIYLCPQRMSEDNNANTERSPIQNARFHSAVPEEDRKDNISLLPLEIMDCDTGCTFSSDDDIPLAQIDGRNPGVCKSLNLDAVVTQKSTHDQPEYVHETLVDLLAKWIPNIKCFKCSKSFPSWSLAKFHFKLQHPNEKFYYKCCHRRFTQNSIKDHLRFHSDPDAFKCLICHKDFTSRPALFSHTAEIHSESLKFSCNECGRRFRSKVGLSNHRSKVHHSNQQDYAMIQLLADGRSAHICQLCGETKYSTAEFRLHKMKMHGFSASKFVCTICGQSRLNARTFREHMASHENKKIYKCAFCPGTYAKIAAVKIHRQRRHPLESGNIFYTYIGESESEPNERLTSTKSYSAASTEKNNCRGDNPPITEMRTSGLEGSKGRTTIMEDVKTDCETSCDGKTEQKYSTKKDLTKKALLQHLRRQKQTSK